MFFFFIQGGIHNRNKIKRKTERTCFCPICYFMMINIRNDNVKRKKTQTVSDLTDLCSHTVQLYSCFLGLFTATQWYNTTSRNKETPSILANMASCTSVTILQKDTEAGLGRCWVEEKVCQISGQWKKRHFQKVKIKSCLFYFVYSVFICTALVDI